MSDLISRKEAVEAVNAYLGLSAVSRTIQNMTSIQEILENLPSAEPKTPSNGSITCVKSENMHDRTTGDLISRQDAIDAIFSEPLYEFGMKKRDADAVVPAIYEKIKSLPSAEKAQLSGEDATSVCKCPCEYREPCDVCHYDAYRGHGCPAEEGLKDE